MVKPMISTLIGIAVEEGKIKSTDNPTNYLPEFKTKRGFEKITIKPIATYLRNKVF
jgi:CubicO group peptidase (beta-lactamase class C family)